MFQFGLNIYFSAANKKKSADVENHSKRMTLNDSEEGDDGHHSNGIEGMVETPPNHCEFYLVSHMRFFLLNSAVQFGLTIYFSAANKRQSADALSNRSKRMKVNDRTAEGETTVRHQNESDGERDPDWTMMDIGGDDESGKMGETAKKCMYTLINRFKLYIFLANHYV